MSVDFVYFLSKRGDGADESFEIPAEGKNSTVIYFRSTPVKTP